MYSKCTGNVLIIGWSLSPLLFTNITTCVVAKFLDLVTIVDSPKLLYVIAAYDYWEL